MEKKGGLQKGHLYVKAEKIRSHPAPEGHFSRTDDPVSLTRKRGRGLIRRKDGMGIVKGETQCCVVDRRGRFEQGGGGSLGGSQGKRKG